MSEKEQVMKELEEKLASNIMEEQKARGERIQKALEELIKGE